MYKLPYSLKKLCIGYDNYQVCIFMPILFYIQALEKWWWSRSVDFSGPTVSRTWARTPFITCRPYSPAVKKVHDDALGHQVSMLIWTLSLTILEMFEYFSVVQLFE